MIGRFLPTGFPPKPAPPDAKPAAAAFAVAITTASGALRCLTSADLLGEPEARAEVAMWAASARREGGDPARYVLCRVVPVEVSS